MKYLAMPLALAAWLCAWSATLAADPPGAEVLWRVAPPASGIPARAVPPAGATLEQIAAAAGRPGAEPSAARAPGPVVQADLVPSRLRAVILRYFDLIAGP